MILTKTQKRQIENQNKRVSGFLEIIESALKSESLNSDPVRVWVGWDEEISDDDLEVLNTKLKEKELIAETDWEPADDHQGHLGNTKCYFQVSKIVPTKLEVLKCALSDLDPRDEPIYPIKEDENESENVFEWLERLFKKRAS